METESRVFEGARVWASNLVFFLFKARPNGAAQKR